MDPCLKDRINMSGKAREVRLGLGSAFMTLRKEPSEEPETQSGTMRQKMHHLLDHMLTHAAIVLLVLMDLLILIFLILIDQKIIQSPPKSNASFLSSSTVASESSVREAESILHIINIIILFIFLLEITARVVTEGAPILKDKFQIFDCIIVVCTFVLYIILTAAKVDRTVTYSIGFIITLRLWRVRRIYSGLKTKERRQAERIINVHRKAREQAEEQVKNLQIQLRQKQEEVNLLQRRLNAVQGSTTSLAANSVNSVDVLSSISSNNPAPTAPHQQRQSWSEGLDKIASEHYYQAKLTNGSLPGYTNTNLASPTIDGMLDKYQNHGHLYGSIQNASIVGNCADKVHNYKMLSASSLSQDINGPGLGTVYSSVTSDLQKAGQLDYVVNEGPKTVAYHDLLQGHCLNSSCIVSTPAVNGVATDIQINGVSRHEDYSDESHGTLIKYASDSALGSNFEDSIIESPPNYSSHSLHSQSNGHPSIQRNKGDKQHLLIRLASAEKEGTAYLNQGFDESSSSLAVITPEEEMEIRRVSKVPFDSVDGLNEDGVIPMTDL